MTVRTRVALAMSAVVAVNILAGAVSFHYFQAASGHAADARTSMERARLAAHVSQSLTTFFSESGGLALAVSQSTLAQERSAIYGSTQGADMQATRAIAGLVDEIGGSEGEALTQEWKDLRETVYAWINVEAELGGDNLRLRLQENGTYVASTGSDVSLPYELSKLTGAELRQAVRANGQALRDGRLRKLAVAEQNRADVAVALEARSQRIARSATLALIALSLLTAAGASFWLYGSIVRPLNQARRYADAITHGDYGVKFEHHGSDEIGTLTLAVEQMKDSVVGKVDTMREVAGVVLLTAEEVSDSLDRVSEQFSEDHDTDLAADIAAAGRGAVLLRSLATDMVQF